MIIELPEWLEDIRTAEVVRRVLDDPRSVAYEQGGNRLWAQAALLEFLVTGAGA